MSTGTATFEFIAALVERLKSRPGLSEVQVLDSYPTAGLGPSAIWAEDAESDHEIPVMKAGTKKVDETVSTSWVIQRLRNDGSEQSATDTDAGLMLGEFQQELAETPQTLVAIQWAQLTGWRMQRGLLATGGHGTRIELTVTHRARLEP